MFAVPLPPVFIPIKLWSPIQQLQKLHQLTTPTCKHASLSSYVAIAFDYPTRNYLIYLHDPVQNYNVPTHYSIYVADTYVPHDDSFGQESPLLLLCGILMKYLNV